MRTRDYHILKVLMYIYVRETGILHFTSIKKKAIFRRSVMSSCRSRDEQSAIKYASLVEIGLKIS